MDNDTLIDALINRIEETYDYCDGTKLEPIFNDIVSKKEMCDLEYGNIEKDILELSKDPIIIKYNELLNKRTVSKANRAKIRKKWSDIKQRYNATVINKNKNVKFLNSLRSTRKVKFHRIPVTNEIAHTISSHAILRYIQRYEPITPYLALYEISDLLKNVIEVTLKPEHTIRELLNHGCTVANFYRTNDIKKLILVVVNGNIITAFKNDFDKFIDKV